MKSKLSLLLSVFILISCLSGITLSALAEDATVIRSGEDLKAIELDGSYILGNNIFLDSSYTSFTGQSFTGTFDGNGKIIYFDGTPNGLFETVAAGATVKNVTTMGVVGDTTNTTDHIAAIAAYNYGTITECRNYADVYGRGWTGGIIGENDNTSSVDTAVVTNCYNFGNVKGGDRSYVGGIIGLNYAPVANCGNTGDVSTAKTRGDYGGIIGADYSMSVSGCYNFGNITAKSSGAGGIVGCAYGGANVVTDCFNAGSVTNPNAYTETIVSAENSTVDLDGDGVYDEYVSGGVNMVGGIIGYIGSRGSGCVISNCYNIGVMTLNGEDVSVAGGLVGGKNPTQDPAKIIPDPSFTNCYYSGSEEDAYDGTTAKTSDELKASDMVTALNADSETAVWKAGTGSYTYPVLTAIELYDAQAEAPEFSIEIDSAEAFTAIQNYPGASFKLVADITLGEGNKTTGTVTSSHTPFVLDGVLDGNGHTITVYVDKGTATDGTSDYAGVFSTLSSGAVVKNLTVDGIIKGNDHLGGVVGAIASESLTAGVTIQGCTNKADITGREKFGGIVGNAYTNVNNSSPVQITGCVNFGTLKSSSRGNIGGIAGWTHGATDVTKCANYGNITAKNNIGGIVGTLQGTISECYNEGTVTNTGGGNTGGIVGSVTIKTAVLKNLHNAGAVSSSGPYGGIAGIDIYGSTNRPTDGTAGYYQYCYNSYAFESDDNALIGSFNNLEAPVIEDCFYLSESTTPAVAGAPIAAEDEQTFADAGFDFTSVWKMENGKLKLQSIKIPDAEDLEDGSAECPYIISTQADFENKISNNLGAYFKLNNDLTLDEAYTPLAFAGVFDGNGYTITYNLTDKTLYNNEAGTSGYYSGLFTYLYNVNSTATTVKNLTVAGSISVSSLNNIYYVGGIAGGIGYYDNLTSAVTERPTAEITIENCVNKVNINCSGNQHGGIVGEAMIAISQTKTILIKKCVNQGNIAGYSHKGGIAGQAGKSVHITETANYSDISGSNIQAGIVGYFTGSITKCYNAGNVTGQSGSTGGIVGLYSETGNAISDLYNAGDIIASSGSFGGIIANASNASAITVENVYNSGAVDDANAIVGTYTAEPVYTSCYYLSEATEADTSKPQPVSAEAAKTQEGFSGFDFTNTWEIADEQIKLINIPLTLEEDSGDEPVVEATVITTAEQFMAMNGVDGVYKLGNDIDLTSCGYTPIKFSGTLDGDGHTVTIAIAGEDTNYLALFADITGAFTIKNLTVAGTVTSTISSSEQFPMYIAGYAAKISGAGTIENCVSEVDITVSRCGHVGGFIGYGYNVGDIVLTNLVNNGTITTNTLEGGEGSNNVGGIAGVTDAELRYCVNNADILGSNNVGGLVGNLYDNISNSYNNGNITATGTVAGGLSGGIAGTGHIISNSYNTGNVVLTSSSAMLGGILGRDASGNTTIENCYNIGSVIYNGADASSYAGITGVVGDSKPVTIVTNSYYLGAAEAVPDSESDNSTAVHSIEEMKALADSLGSAYAASESADYPFPQLNGLTNTKKVLIAFAKAYDSGDISVSALASLSESTQLSLIGKNAVIVALELAGADITEAGFNVNGTEYTATLTNGKALVVLSSGTAAAGDTVTLTPYAKRGDTASTGAAVIAEYKTVQP